MSTSNGPSQKVQYLVLGIGILAISSGSILIRMAQDQGAPSLAIAFWRTMLAALIIYPFTLINKRNEVRALPGPSWLLALLSGLLLGIHFATWISSLAFTSIINSTVLVATVPIWVALASPIVLKEPISRGVKQGITLAIAGTIVISLSAIAEPGGGSNPMLGNALALIGGIAAAGYLLLGRRLRPHLSLLSYTTIVYGMAGLTLLLFNLVSGTAILGYAPQVVALFLVIAVVPQLIGHSSLNWALSFLPAAYVAIVAISEPVGATLLAMIIFREFPGPLVIAGSAIILAGVFLASRDQA
ncbi:MAG: DMT family transporter [Candidatus Promineifilaceae bacterium]|jgi:drug/metabolite transporter (DMT)-like permease